MAVVHPEILSFLSKFTELLSHGFDANLQLNSFHGKVYVNLRTELDVVPPIQQTPFPKTMKRAKARRRRRRECAREASNNVNNEEVNAEVINFEDTQNNEDFDRISSYVVNNSNTENPSLLPKCKCNSSKDETTTDTFFPSSSTPHFSTYQQPPLMNISLEDFKALERSFDNEPAATSNSNLNQLSREEDLQKIKNLLNFTPQA